MTKRLVLITIAFAAVLVLCLAQILPGVLRVRASGPDAPESMPDVQWTDDEKAVDRLACQYVQGRIAGDTALMYSLLSPNRKQHRSKTEFEDECKKVRESVEYTKILGSTRARMRSENLALVQLEVAISVHKGRKAGTKGKTLVTLHAERVDGQWGVLPKAPNTDSPYDTDPARIADEFVLAWWGLRDLPANICQPQKTSLRDSAGEETSVDTSKWEAEELSRLRKIGDLALPLTGEFVARDGKTMCLRTGFRLMPLDGKMVDAEYQLRFEKDTAVTTTRGAVWRLVSIEPVGVSRTTDLPWQLRYAGYPAQISGEVKAITDSELKAWVEGSSKLMGNAICEMAQSGGRLMKYRLGELLQVDDYYAHPGNAVAHMEVFLTYEKDQPPQIVSGRNIVTLKQMDSSDGTAFVWYISDIRPVTESADTSEAADQK